VQNAAEMTKLLAELPQYCELLWPILPPPVSSSLSLCSYHLCLSSAHPPDQLPWPNLPQIDAVFHHPKHIATPPISSRLPLAPQDAIDDPDQAPEHALSY
jgi:hypothetical protein